MVIWIERKMNNSILKNDLLRNYPERDAKNFTVLVFNCSITAIMILISITGNSLIVLSILKNHSLRSPSMILIFGLALSDLLLGLVAQPLYIAKELSDYLSLQSACYFFLYNCCGVSLWTMTAISLDRLAALHLHMKYTSLVTSTRVTQVLGTIWIVIHLSFGIYFWNERAYFFLAGCFVLICLTLTSFSYTRIFQIVYRHQRQIHNQHQSLQRVGASSILTWKRFKKSVVNTFIFYLFLLLFHIPSFLIMFLFAIFQNWSEVWNISTTVIFMSSSTNPILLCWRLRELRAAVLKTAKRLLCLRTT